jgi:LPXTG-site transpeptidase (sortase) family protein
VTEVRTAVTWSVKPLFLRALLALTIALTAAVPLLEARPTTAEAPRTYYVEKTGHLLTEPFLSFWIENEGLTSLGFPVTEPLYHAGRITQYFEFGALLLKNNGEVTRIKVGRDLLATRHEPDYLIGSRRVGSDRNPKGFTSPRKSEAIERPGAYRLSGSIRSFYEQSGGEERFGKPLSNPYVVTGQQVQWFEYGRIEIGGSRPSAAPVGFELATSLSLPTAPAQRGDLPVFEPTRFRSYSGDGTIPEARGVFEPVRISIPKIQVNASIERVPISNGVMEVPVNAWNVGWYPSVSRPGEWTNVVMSAHRDWWNLGPVVFWNLDKVVPGDKIYVTGPDGTGFTYRVYDSYLVSGGINANVLIEDTGFESLTLITCAGAFNGIEYEERLIVRAERI